MVQLMVLRYQQTHAIRLLKFTFLTAHTYLENSIKEHIILFYNSGLWAAQPFSSPIFIMSTSGGRGAESRRSRKFLRFFDAMDFISG